MHLLTEAELILENQKVAQPEQRYILAEMDRYFFHPSVGVSTFDRMNSEWKDVNAQVQAGAPLLRRSEEHTSELQSLMRISYAVLCLKQKRIKSEAHITKTITT